MSSTETLVALLDDAAEQFDHLALRSHYDRKQRAVAVEVGDVLRASYRWDDGDSTDDELDGTSCIEIRRSGGAWQVERALRLIAAYRGGTLCLVGSNRIGSDYCADEGEVILRDPVVIAVLA